LNFVFVVLKYDQLQSQAVRLPSFHCPFLVFPVEVV